MLRDRPDAAELLELLDFHPPSWPRYYDELWSRYPTLAEDWVHAGFLNLPATWVPDEEQWKRERDIDARRRQVHEERVHRDQLILSEIRAKVLGSWRSGALSAPGPSGYWTDGWMSSAFAHSSRGGPTSRSLSDRP